MVLRRVWIRLLGHDMSTGTTDDEEADAETRQRLLAVLVERRKALGLKQSDLAAHLGVGQQEVSMIERGKVGLRLETLQRYARAVGVRLRVEVVLEVS